MWFFKELVDVWEVFDYYDIIKDFIGIKIIVFLYIIFGFFCIGLIIEIFMFLI